MIKLSLKNYFLNYTSRRTDMNKLRRQKRFTFKKFEMDQSTELPGYELLRANIETQ